MGWRIWKNTSAVKKSARELAACWQDGDLVTARAGYYCRTEEECSSESELRDQSTIRFVSMQDLADQYGTEILTAGEEEEENRQLLRIIMKYSRLAVSAGMTLTSKTTVSLYINGPDVESWLEQMGDYERADLTGSRERYERQLTEALEEGTIPYRSAGYRIPAEKENGVWRFEVTEDTETALYGGYLPEG